jgi:copper chaperone
MPDTTTRTYDIRGMTCDNCVQHVTKAIRGVDGVKDVKVDLASHSAVVEGTPDDQKIIEAVEEEGYEATPAS